MRLERYANDLQFKATDRQTSKGAISSDASILTICKDWTSHPLQRVAAGGIIVTNALQFLSMIFESHANKFLCHGISLHSIWLSLPLTIKLLLRLPDSLPNVFLSNLVDGIILNAAAYTHTSVGIADAVKAITTPVIEVHISNTFARETFRHHSFLSSNVKGIIIGFGMKSYELALQSFL